MDRDGWNEALDGIPHSFGHTWENCQAMHLTTGYPTFLYRCDGPNGRVVCPIAERSCGEYFEAVTPFGFSGFSAVGEIENFPSVWWDFAKSRGWITAYIALNPVLERPGFGDASQVRCFNDLYFLELTMGEEVLFSRCARSRRSEIRKWQKKTRLVFDRHRITDFYFANFKSFYKSRNASPVYHFDPRTLAFLFRLPNVYLVGAEVEGQIEAVLLCTSTKYTAEALFFVTSHSSAGSRHLAGMLWHAATHYISEEVPYLNLGGGVRPNDGIAQFKRLFGAQSFPAHSIQQVLQPEIYRRLCEIHGVNETAMNDYFPPYQKPTLRQVG